MVSEELGNWFVRSCILDLATLSWFYTGKYPYVSEKFLTGHRASTQLKVKKYYHNSSIKVTKNSTPFRSRSGPEIVKLFSCSTQLSMKFILLINVKTTTIVVVLTFISRMNTTSESFKVRLFIIFRHFTFCEQLKFQAKMS